MLRLLPHQISDGQSNMAIDEALLISSNDCVLRTYEWKNPTVSLGYFQDYNQIIKSLPPSCQTKNIVRRITGGGAIFHHNEITYCLIANIENLPEKTADIYKIIHKNILEELKKNGANLSLQSFFDGDKRYRKDPRCFASPAKDDIIHNDGGKVLGSSGRTHKNKMLIHGSLKLKTNNWDEETVASCEVNIETAKAAVIEGIKKALKKDAEFGELTESEMSKIKEIKSERYKNDEWVKLRLGRKP